jgi:hypothetical protein
VTPDNAGYYYAAYVATAVIYVLYAVSIVVRLRKARGRQRSI